MTHAIAWTLSGVLGLIALLHLLWGLGMSFPCRDRETLFRTVVGAKGRDRMPGLIPSAAVAVVLTALAVLPLVLTAIVLIPLPWRWTQLAGLGAVTGFALRGLAAWFPPWRAAWPKQPFARLDQMVYGPLCLALGAGFGFLLFCHPA